MKQTILTIKQSELLENLIVKYGQMVTSHQIFDEASASWDYKQSKNLITKLVKNGWLIRIKRGLYAISDLSSRGSLTISPLVVANLLVSDSYVSFELALSQHGMFDQLTIKTRSVSLKAYKSVRVAGLDYGYIKTKPEYFFGWQEILIDHQPARVATPEKALVDMINFHKSHYSIDLVVEKLSDYRNDLDLIRLNDYLSKFPVTTIKIFGLIFDFLGIDSDGLLRLVSKRGTHWMIPGDKKFNSKWRLYYSPYFDKYKAT
jgi:predicted transcriptional regulator of viral defense system